MFHVGEITSDHSGATGGMQSGPWTVGPDPAGSGSAGSLGLLADDTFSAAILPHRPNGHWAVTTEMSLNFYAPVPTDGQQIIANARIVSADARVGSSHGTIRTANGTMIASGSEQLRFFAGSISAEWEPVGESPVDERRPFFDLLALRTTPNEHGLTLELPAGPLVSNPLGIVHGGIGLCLSEMAGLMAVQPFIDHAQTSSIHIFYARPTPVGQMIRYVAEIIYQGRTLAIVQVNGRRSDGKICTTATVTCHQVLPAHR
jgi:uncharacterized protein (TIGR00369 family)